MHVFKLSSFGRLTCHCDAGPDEERSRNPQCCGGLQFGGKAGAPRWSAQPAGNVREGPAGESGLLRPVALNVAAMQGYMLYVTPLPFHTNAHPSVCALSPQHSSKPFCASGLVSCISFKSFTHFMTFSLWCDLQDYLETKRVAFPRFYFVAPADLLDILSKGSNPQLILRYASSSQTPACYQRQVKLQLIGSC